MKITDRQLAVWLYHQRERCIDPRRRALMEKIPGWVWNPNAADAAWEEAFKQFQKYGPLIKQRFVTKNGFHLGQWMNNQRNRCENPEQRKRLESIPGWTWNRRDDMWEEGFKQLQKHGPLVPQNFITKDDFKLGQWISNQRLRSACKDPEKRKRLESIPGWMWDASILKNKIVREKMKSKACKN